MKMQISPSLLAADFARLDRQLDAVAKGGADMLHLDVMDGVFVPNISFGMPVIASLRRVTDLFFDVHIMIVEPQRYVEALAKAGADGITFHVEAAEDPGAVIDLIHRQGIKAGITLSPDTPAQAILPYLDRVELALVMTVKPGVGGQSFREDMMPKLEAIADRARRLGREDLILQVDGGIDERTAPLCAARGANCFVAGSAVFGTEELGGAISAIRQAAQQAAKP